MARAARSIAGLRWGGVGRARETYGAAARVCYPTMPRTRWGQPHSIAGPMGQIFAHRKNRAKGFISYVSRRVLPAPGGKGSRIRHRGTNAVFRGECAPASGVRRRRPSCTDRVAPHRKRTTCPFTPCAGNEVRPGGEAALLVRTCTPPVVGRGNQAAHRPPGRRLWLPGWEARGRGAVKKWRLREKPLDCSGSRRTPSGAAAYAKQSTAAARSTADTRIEALDAAYRSPGRPPRGIPESRTVMISFFSERASLADAEPSSHPCHSPAYRCPSPPMADPMLCSAAWKPFTTCRWTVASFPVPRLLPVTMTGDAAAAGRHHRKAGT